MKKKLIHVVNALNSGGVEQGVFMLAKEGFYNAFDFHLVELYRGSGPMRDQIVDILGSDRMINLRGDKRGKMLPPNPGVKRVLKQIERSFELPRLVWNLQNTFRDLKPDTVVLSDEIVQLVGRSAVAIFPKIKAVSFEHNTTADPLPLKIALKLTSFRSDAVIGDANETIKFRSGGYYLKSQPTDVVPLTVLEAKKDRVIREPETFQVLSLGRLMPQKNYVNLVHAAAQLIKEGHKFELTIAGEGLQQKQLEEIIGHYDAANPGLGISKRIKLPGFVAGEKATRELRDAADIYVQPSKYEGFSISTAEALASGLPTITTDFAGVREYGNERNIVKIRGYEPEGIADALRHVMVNYKSIAPGLSEAALETARTRFSEDAVRMQWAHAAAFLEEPRKPSPPTGMRPSRVRHYTRG